MKHYMMSRGSGGWPPRKMLAFRHYEVEPEASFD